MTPIDFATPAPKVSWRTAVRDYLAALPADGWTPAQDLALVEGAFRGDGRVGRSHLENLRLAQLLRAITDGRGVQCYEGRLHFWQH